MFFDNITDDNNIFQRNIHLYFIGDIFYFTHTTRYTLYFEKKKTYRYNQELDYYQQPRAPTYQSLKINNLSKCFNGNSGYFVFIHTYKKFHRII